MKMLAEFCLSRALRKCGRGDLTPRGCRGKSGVRAPRLQGLLILCGTALALVSGCSRTHETRWQGYLEGEFVYVAAPVAGRLEQLAVQKGARVEKGVALFTLEQQSELAAQRQAGDQLRAAQARMEDLKKGS